MRKNININRFVPNGIKIIKGSQKIRELTREELKVGLNTVGACLGVKTQEKVMVITDPGAFKPASIIFEAAKIITDNVELWRIPVPEQHGKEPDEKVARVISEADVAFLVTTKSLSHTNARRNATKKGVRIASMPGITYEVFLRTMAIDYSEIKKLTQALSKILTAGKKVRLTSPAGTNLTMSIEEMVSEADTGIFTDKGLWGNLPSGEAMLSPKEGTANGIIVIDGCSYLEEVSLDKPIVMEVKRGLVTKISGGKAASSLEKTLNNIGPKARNIAELGIGTNKMAKLNSSILEVEKVFGTVHIGLGNNISYGGTMDVPFHSDGVILYPKLEIDGRVILKEGKFHL